MDLWESRESPTMSYELNQWTKPLEDLEAHNRNPEILEEHAVPSGSRPDMAHVVRKVSVLTKPFEQADSAVDCTTLWVCTCEDTQYNRWPSDGTLPPLESYVGCKHCREFKAEKAIEDENQSELFQ